MRLRFSTSEMMKSSVGIEKEKVTDDDLKMKVCEKQCAILDFMHLAHHQLSTLIWQFNFDFLLRFRSRLGFLVSYQSTPSRTRMTKLENTSKHCSLAYARIGRQNALQTSNQQAEKRLESRRPFDIHLGFSLHNTEHSSQGSAESSGTSAIVERSQKVILVCTFFQRLPDRSFQSSRIDL